MTSHFFILWIMILNSTDLEGPWPLRQWVDFPPVFSISELPFSWEPLQGHPTISSSLTSTSSSSLLVALGEPFFEPYPFTFFVSALLILLVTFLISATIPGSLYSCLHSDILLILHTPPWLTVSNTFLKLYRLHLWSRLSSLAVKSLIGSSCLYLCSIGKHLSLIHI